MNKSQEGLTDLTKVAQSMIIIPFNKYYDPLESILAPGSAQVRSNSPNSIFAGFQINTMYIYSPSLHVNFMMKKIYHMPSGRKTLLIMVCHRILSTSSSHGLCQSFQD